MRLARVAAGRVPLVAYATTQSGRAIDLPHTLAPSNCAPGTSHIACWKCRTPLECERDRFFCAACDTIQPPVKCVNYFQALGIEPHYDVDMPCLKSCYRRWVAALHPDRFVTATQEEKEYSEQQSMFINQAHNVLCDPLQRAVYLLRLHGRTLNIDEQHSPEGMPELEPEFLMGMLELNERIEESDSVDELRQIAEDTDKALASCYDELKGQLDTDTPDLNAAAEVVARASYYRRIATHVNRKLMKLDK